MRAEDGVFPLSLDPSPKGEGGVRGAATNPFSPAGEKVARRAG